MPSDADLKRAAEQIGRATQIHQRRNAGGTNRHTAGAAPPGTAKTVADDHGYRHAELFRQAPAQYRRAAVWIDRQQQRALGLIWRGHIGLVDARIGHHEAQPMLDDQDSGPRPHDAHRFRQDQLDETRIFLDFRSEFDRFSRGFDSCEINHAPFSLGHDLLRQHEDVAATRRDVAARQRLADQRDEIVVLAHQRNTGDGEDLDGVAKCHRSVPRTQSKRLRSRGSTCSP